MIFTGLAGALFINVIDKQLSTAGGYANLMGPILLVYDITAAEKEKKKKREDLECLVSTVWKSSTASWWDIFQPPEALSRFLLTAQMLSFVSPKLAFCASCRPSEKQNSGQKLICWRYIHTGFGGPHGMMAKVWEHFKVKRMSGTMAWKCFYTGLALHQRPPKCEAPQCQSVRFMVMYWGHAKG